MRASHVLHTLIQLNESLTFPTHSHPAFGESHISCSFSPSSMRFSHVLLIFTQLNESLTYPAHSHPAQLESHISCSFSSSSLRVSHVLLILTHPRDQQENSGSQGGEGARRKRTKRTMLGGLREIGHRRRTVQEERQLDPEDLKTSRQDRDQEKGTTTCRQDLTPQNPGDKRGEQLQHSWCRIQLDPPSNKLCR